MKGADDSRTIGGASKGGQIVAIGKGAPRAALPVEVARQVEQWVRSGRFAEGSKLPPERELATNLGTSRNVLREALRILETRGVVLVRHGVGTFVHKLTPPSSTAIPVRLNFELAWLPVAEILTARRAVECAVAEVAAQARDELDIEEMREVLGVTSTVAGSQDLSEWVAVDLRFHELLGHCTHNSLLRTIQLELTRATSAVREVASESQGAVRAAVQFHAAIGAAVIKGDSKAAAAAMMMHLVDIEERALSALAAQKEPVDRHV